MPGWGTFPPVVAIDVPAGLKLQPIGAEARPVEEWTITFQLLAVVLDPYTYESAWVLETAGRILEHFQGASVRNAFVLTCGEDDAKAFLGPWAKRVLTFVDPEREFVKACGLDRLPALVHLRQDLVIEAAAEGWEPMAWRAIGHEVAREAQLDQAHHPLPQGPRPLRGQPRPGSHRPRRLSSPPGSRSRRGPGPRTVPHHGEPLVPPRPTSRRARRSLVGPGAGPRCVVAR